MKKLGLLFSGVLFSFGVFAQSQEMGFGIKAGVNLPNYRYTNSSGSNAWDSDATTNFHVTAYLDAPISNYFAVQPGLSLQGKGAKLMESDFGNTTVTQNTMWLEIPVNFTAKIPTGDVGSFIIGAGPYVGIGLTGKNKYASDLGEAEREFDFGADGSLKRTDFGANILAGYQMNQGISVTANYGLGLTDISPNWTSNKIFNRVWAISLGFRI